MHVTHTTNKPTRQTDNNAFEVPKKHDNIYRFKMQIYKCLNVRECHFRLQSDNRICARVFRLNPDICFPSQATDQTWLKCQKGDDDELSGGQNAKMSKMHKCEKAKIPKRGRWWTVWWPKCQKFQNIKRPIRQWWMSTRVNLQQGQRGERRQNASFLLAFKCFSSWLLLVFTTDDGNQSTTFIGREGGSRFVRSKNDHRCQFNFHSVESTHIRIFALKNCLATKQRKQILGVLAALVGVFVVLCIGMVYLLHEIEHSELGLVYLVFHYKMWGFVFIFSP